MKLGYTILYVADVPATVTFYEEAFGLKRRFVHESGYAELDTGATTLAFASESLATSNGVTYRPNRKDAEAPGVEIAFITDDVQAAFDQAVKAGATATVAPKTKPWGQIVGYVRDLNGVLIEIGTHVAT